MLLSFSKRKFGTVRLFRLINSSMSVNFGAAVNKFNYSGESESANQMKGLAADDIKYNECRLMGGLSTEDVHRS